MREIAFDLNAPGWTSSIIAQLNDVLAEFSDMFGTFSPNVGSCPLTIVQVGCAKYLFSYFAVMTYYAPDRQTSGGGSGECSSSRRSLTLHIVMGKPR